MKSAASTKKRHGATKPSGRALPGQASLRFAGGGQSLAELDAEIAKLTDQLEIIVDQLASLQRVRKGKLGALAARNSPRGRQFSDLKIERAYVAAGGGGYGAVRKTALALGCSEQTVRRWLGRHRAIIAAAQAALAPSPLCAQIQLPRATGPEHPLRSPSVVTEQSLPDDKPAHVQVNAVSDG